MLFLERGVARRAMARSDRALEERVRRAEAALGTLQQRVQELERSVSRASAQMERLTPTVEELLGRLAGGPAPSAAPGPPSGPPTAPPSAAASAPTLVPPYSRNDLLTAARTGDVAAVRAALQAGADVLGRDKDGNTPLHCAVLAGSPGAVRALLAGGAPVNALDGRQSTALHLAAVPREMQQDVLCALLEAGAAPDALDAAGRSALVVAAEWGATAALQLLLRKWSPPSQVARCLERAQSRAVVEALLQERHPPVVRGPVGGAALRSAARDGRLEALRALLEAGAPVNDRDTRGFTAAHYVAQSESCRAGECARELTLWGVGLEAETLWHIPWVVALLHGNLHLVLPLMPLVHVPKIIFFAFCVLVFLIIFSSDRPKARY